MKKYILPMLSVLLLQTACSQEKFDNLPEKENSFSLPPKTIKISVSGELSIGEAEPVVSVEDSLKGLTFDLTNNPGKNYPRPTISPQNGDKISVISILHNDDLGNDSGTTVLSQNEWTYQDGKLSYRGPISFPADVPLNQHADKWTLACLVGVNLIQGTYDAEFAGISQVRAVAEGESININTLYASSEEPRKSLVYTPENQTFGFKHTDHLNLVPRGTLLLLQATNTQQQNVTLKGFRIETKGKQGTTLLFDGLITDIDIPNSSMAASSFILGNLPVRKTVLEFLPDGNEEILRPGETSKYYIVWVMPPRKGKKLHTEIRAIYDNNSEGPIQTYTKKFAEGNFYSIQGITI